MFILNSFKEGKITALNLNFDAFSCYSNIYSLKEREVEYIDRFKTPANRMSEPIVYFPYLVNSI